MVNVIAVILISAGIFFFIIGTVGIIRFPDALTRAHGAAKCDSLGALLCLVGILIYHGGIFTDLKIVLIILFLWFTNPTGTHVLAKAISKSLKNSNSR